MMCNTKMINNDQLLITTSIHEAGHALVAFTLGATITEIKLTLQDRRMRGKVTARFRENKTDPNYLEKSAKTALAGQVALEVMGIPKEKRELGDVDDDNIQAEKDIGQLCKINGAFDRQAEDMFLEKAKEELFDFLSQYKRCLLELAAKIGKLDPDGGSLSTKECRILLRAITRPFDAQHPNCRCEE